VLVSREHLKRELVTDSQAEKQRKLLRVRIEMAKFLQETVRGSGLKMDNVIKSDEFKQFFRKVCGV
jgi:LETM1 and EF-hand domain-containing protein 1